MPKHEKLIKARSNWVDGNRFYDRDTEMEALDERFEEGGHTLLTAQRRMGKTSLIREFLRRLDDAGTAETLFIDVEGANSAADAIAEIAAQALSRKRLWTRVMVGFKNGSQQLGGKIEEVAVSELKVKLRAGIDAGNWQQKGDEVFAALASHDIPVVLAIDELPILVNRILKGQDYQITPERKEAADEFLSWLRKNGQAHRGKVIIMIFGSVGLEPILKQAGLSAQANIFPAFELKPWTAEVAGDCLAALANNYGLDLPVEVRADMCARLRCCIPHHVQRFFDHLHEHLRRAGRKDATLKDVERVYEDDLLSVRGQIDLEHYESRLKLVLGEDVYLVALDILTEAASEEGASGAAIARLQDNLKSSGSSVSVEDVMYVLEHDGYLERAPEGYRFVSGLLEDWWRARHCQYFVPVSDRE